MKVLVTGANGFLATHLIQQLLEKNYEVVGSVRSLERAPKIFNHVSYFAANLTSSQGWLEAMKDVEAIFHVASPLGHDNANNPQLIQEAVSGVEVVFQAAKNAGVKRLIMTSSQAAATPQAKTTGIITEDFWSDPKNPELNAYRLSKLFAEKKAWELAKKYQLDLTTILPGAIFGPALTANRSSNQVLDGIKVAKFVPNISLEVTDVRDLAALHILALEKSQTIGERYIAKNNDLTFQEIAEIFGNHSFLLPDFLLKISGKFVGSLRALVPMLQRKYTHSNEKALQIGWQARAAKETVLAVFKPANK